MRCPKCGGYSFDSDDRCLGCGHTIASNMNPPPWWGMPTFRKKSGPEGNTPKQPVKLSVCPHCGQTSLFFNETNQRYECLNLECKKSKSNIFDNVIWPDDCSEVQESQSECISTLSNPILLGVKMFLADIRSWRRQYREGEYVCADFTREVFDAATERGIRCGYVVISFDNSDVGHAIIAFETDYGLKFFEPQSGNEEDVVVGRRYSAQAEGTQQDNVISKIEIIWNDEASTRID